MGYLKILSVSWVIALFFGVSVAQAAPDPREMSAREAFGAGRYQDALDLFAKLYAEKLDPIYLRNIGRCYQNLSEPDRAISSFREYMRKGKHIKPAERAEIEGYISEMEALKKTQEAERNAALKPPPPATPVATTPPASANPTENKVVITERDLAAPKPASPPAIEISAPHPAPEPEESHSVVTRWWFWAIVGGVVAAGVGGAAAAGLFTKKNDASCMTGVCK